MAILETPNLSANGQGRVFARQTQPTTGTVPRDSPSDDPEDQKAVIRRIMKELNLSQKETAAYIKKNEKIK